MENKVIALLGRGNEGKSTTAHYLAREFSMMGHEVTVVSTDNFGKFGKVGLDQVMLGLAPIEDAILDTGEGYGFISGGEDLDLVATNLGSQDMIAQKMGKRPMGVLTLGLHLRKLPGIVIIDTRAYNQDFWADSAIIAACQAIAVVKPQADSLERLESMREHVESAKHVGACVSFAGVIATMIGGSVSTAVKSRILLMRDMPDYLGETPVRTGNNKKDLISAYQKIALSITSK